MKEKIKELVSIGGFEKALDLMLENPEVAHSFIKLMYNYMPTSELNRILQGVCGRDDFHRILPSGFPYNKNLCTNILELGTQPLNTTTVLSKSLIFSGIFPSDVELNITAEKYPNLDNLLLVYIDSKVVIAKKLKFLYLCSSASNVYIQEQPCQLLMQYELIDALGNSMPTKLLNWITQLEMDWVDMDCIEMPNLPAFFKHLCAVRHLYFRNGIIRKDNPNFTSIVNRVIELFPHITSITFVDFIVENEINFANYDVQVNFLLLGDNWNIHLCNQ